MISPIDKAILEIGSGSWFITSIGLVIIFGYHIIQHLAYDKEWRQSVTLRASLAFIAYGLGSAMRAGLAWRRFASDDYSGAEMILTWWPWFEISIVLNAIGAAFAIYILAPDHRARRAWILVGIAFAAPALIWLI
jgi:hypothetical protein